MCVVSSKYKSNYSVREHYWINNIMETKKCKKFTETDQKRRTLLREAVESVTLEKLHRSTAPVGESVYRATIVYALHKSCLYGKFTNRKPLLKWIKLFQKNVVVAVKSAHLFASVFLLFGGITMQHCFQTMRDAADCMAMEWCIPDSYTDKENID